MSAVDDLLAWSGWRWMVGMRESECGAICVAVLDSDPWQWAIDGSLTEAEDDGAQPDLAHAGTLGCIEHGLLRQAWGPTAKITVRTLPDGHATISVLVDDYVEHSGLRRPLADALVAACLAAPARGAT